MNTASTAPPAVLAGVRVLELGARIGAAVAGSLLAQLGAEVIFVEGRGSDGFAQPKWQHRDPLSAGKRSLCPGPDDGALLAQLAAGADVVLRSSDVDAAALGAAAHPDALAAAWAGAVVCDVTAFGSSGPRRGEPATDAEVQARTGVMDATGLADGPPLPLALPLVEQLAGVYAAAGVLASLRAGAAEPVEVALYDVAFSAMTSFLAPVLCDPGHAQPARVGNRHTMAAPWNVYRARDGWLLLCAGNDTQWERICALIGTSDPRLARNAARVAHVDAVDALLQSWVLPQRIEDCVRRLSGQGIPCGPVAPLDGFPREANLEHRGMVQRVTTPDGRALYLPASPLRLQRTPGIALRQVPAPDADRAALRARPGARPAAAGRGAAPALPLAGIRVVEIGHYTTAPVAARLLAALGAEVIKVEPPEGEAVRRWPPTRQGQGVFFAFQNADKRSLVLDLGSAQDLERLHGLLAGADVLIENLRPGALARKGLADEALAQRHPHLVRCAISGFGADALYAGRAAFDAVIQAVSGLMATQRAGEVPLKTGPSLADVFGAATGLLAVLAALHARGRSGIGQAIDLSMQDICAWAIQTGWNGAAPAAGGQVQPGAQGWCFVAPGRAAVPVLPIQAVVRQPQTSARRLWAEVEAHGACFPVLASPLRIGSGDAPLPRPGPLLGADTTALLAALR